MGGTRRRKSNEERPAMCDAVIDPAFQCLVDQGGDTLRGLWRVQKLELVAVPKGQEGKFYEGDCYLHFDKDTNEQHVHFWIGGQCSVDEQAVDAIKAVELDTLFGGLPIQHREAQGFESKRFKDQFPDGIMIKKGGMESGLQKAETNAHEAKLFKVAGGMRPVMTEVNMAWSSMNHGDVFVLDSGKKIFVWKGSGASGQEKFIRENGLPLRQRSPGPSRGESLKSSRAFSRFGRTLFCLKLDFSFVIVNCFLGIAVSLFRLWKSIGCV